MELDVVYNEDCLQVLQRLKDGSVDLLLQDPPFGVTQNEWDVKPDLDVMWKEWERVTKPNGAMIFFATQPFASELIQSNADNFRYEIIWQKSHSTGFLNAQKIPLRIHENILVFYRSLPTYNPQLFDKPKHNIRPIPLTPRASDNYGEFKHGNFRTIPTDKSYPDSVVYFENNSKTDTVHPTQKPVDLVRYLVMTYSNEGDVVFDGYGGSGTTAEACIEENRRFVLCETDPSHFEYSVGRVKKLKSSPKLFF